MADRRESGQASRRALGSQTEGRAVFLDRDGTLIEDVNFLREPSGIRIMPGAPEAIRLLREGGYRIIIVSNQSGVARGCFTEEKLVEINEKVQALFAEAGAAIDAVYYCPHLPEGIAPEYAIDCLCRKPLPGMFFRAAADWNIELTDSFAIGDSERDVEAGRRAGCHTILVKPDPPERTVADALAPTILDAARQVISWEQQP